ncbi:MAG: hypothetical protein V1874_13130 [Spirochaetota bacterium]
MAQKNMVSVSFSETDIRDINNAIAVLKNTLLPKLKELKPEEKKNYPLMGDKSIAFVQKALEYCGYNEELTPKFFDADEFTRDFKAVEVMRNFRAPLTQISNMLMDTMCLAGTDSFSAALMFYNSVKIARKANIPKSQTIHDELAKRFPGKGGDPDSEEK